MDSKLRSVPLWLPLWLLVAGISIFLHGPVPMFSTRTLTVAWEMWHLGEWLIPHQNGLPYSHKAPLLYWLIHSGWAMFGVSDVWPRLLELGLSTANLGLVAVLARRLFPDRPAVARLAPWVLAGTSYWFLYSLQIMFDLLVSACVLLALCGLARRDDRGGFAPQWSLVALGLGLGLLSKGPVALLHLAVPLLLGPWWNDAARAQPMLWYRRVAASIGIALALFALWLAPVALFGGEAYRKELLVTQTAGRLVQSFDHGRPLWWYLAILPALLFPWFFWLAAWRGLRTAVLGQVPGLRLLGFWLIGSLVAFSLISGKQAYYLLPQLAGFAVWLSAVVDREQPVPVQSKQTIGPAIGLLVIGAAVAALPSWVAGNRIDSAFVVDFASAGIGFGLGVCALAVGLLALRTCDARQALPRIAASALLAMALLHGQFTLSAWPRYDLQPVARLLASHAAQGKPIANRGRYEGQFNFLARLTAPVVELNYNNGLPWAAAHPDALIVDYVKARTDRPPPPGAVKPMWRGPFRGEVIEVWRAADWLAWRSAVSAG